MAPQGLEKDHRKPCTLCSSPRDVLVRCQIDTTEKWHFVCPGACWRRVSGGEVDGDGREEHKWYRYGGMWKNKHEAVSAKKPKGKPKKRQVSGRDASTEAAVGEDLVQRHAAEEFKEQDYDEKVDEEISDKEIQENDAGEKLNVVT